ncbi:MAG: hypothetical protein QOE46_3303 [Acidobacteriota bacterium]|nr:hypothetical protein [Acidobacteriota bacterium]
MTTSRTHFAALFLLTLLACSTARAQQPPALMPTPVVIQETRPQPAPTQPTQSQSPRIQSPPSAEASKAARAALPPITGRVVGDAGEPIPGISVSALSRSAGRMPRSPRTVTADEGGNFQFTGLDPGLYTLSAGLPGYVLEVDPLTGRPGSTYRPGDTAIVRLTKGGVVTGTVADQQGEPVVAVSVRALRVHDLDGRAPQTPFPYTADDRTDDRGVYRIYGLQPGLYVVFAGGYSNAAFGLGTPYAGDVPTFYPSGTRDTANEVAVRAGQETAGIDIRYREEQGHRVTGTVDATDAAPGDYGAGIVLTYASTGMPAGSTGLGLNSSPDRSFSIEGVADGDYDVQVTAGGREGLTGASTPLRVSVRGADVTGLRLSVKPLASLSGTLVVEPAPEDVRALEACKSVRSRQLPQETLITVAPDHAKAAANHPFSRLTIPHDTTPDEAGAFSLRALEPGRYRLSFRLFDEALYVRAVQLPGTTPTAAPRVVNPAPRAAADSTRELIELKPGQQLSGLSVHLTEGAASFGGRIAPAEGGAAPPYAQMHVHLVPAERERADDPSRFYEAATAADGTFAFKNLAPGRYLVLARVEADAGDSAATRPAALDTDARARLRREAEAANTPAELQPCQRTTDFVLHFPVK